MSGRADRPGENLPERRLTNDQFELVIKRAAELQARAADQAGEEGMSEAEVVRIGRELGLSGSALSQAIAEVGAPAAEPHGLLDHWLGQEAATASRTVPMNADDVMRMLEEYLVEREYMSVLRRFPDHVLYSRDESLAATLGRAKSQVFERTQPLKLSNLEVAVRPLEEGYSYVTFTSRLNEPRFGFAIGGLGGGGAAGISIAAVLGIAVAPAAAILGVPVLGGFVYGMRAGYRHMHAQT
ncbi:MAG TPA: hypothetical protein VFI96_04630, partial [Longimicrobiaceae bacterium]|nr:hypothetical protein [Longimicrobiaceae bacterium]